MGAISHPSKLPMEIKGKYITSVNLQEIMDVSTTTRSILSMPEGKLEYTCDFFTLLLANINMHIIPHYSLYTCISLCAREKEKLFGKQNFLHF